ncbi:MAG: DUF4956 domain-containing protein [Blastocatellia bacterium]
MPEWLQAVVHNGQGIAPGTLIARLVLSFALGAAVAGIYRWTHRRDEAPSPTFLTTLVLMTIVIAMSTQVIGDNVARAFSLVGALSIVRFRTVVQDTRDTAYVIFAVVVGMAAGAGYFTVALVGIFITGLASFVMRPQAFAWELPLTPLTLTVRLSNGHNPEVLFSQPFAQYIATKELCATALAKRGGAHDFTYQVQLREGVSQAALIGALSAMEGVQSVSLWRN